MSQKESFISAPPAISTPGGSIKVEPGEHVETEKSPSTSHLKMSQKESFISAPPAISTPGGSIKVEPGEHVETEKSPSTSRLKTSKSPRTPCVTTPKRTPKRTPKQTPKQTPKRTPTSGRKRAASSKTGSPRSARRKLDYSQIVEEICDSGSEDDFSACSSDDEDYTPDPVNMRLVAQRLRELNILQEEGQGPAMAELLEEADVALEEFLEDGGVSVDPLGDDLVDEPVGGGDSQVLETAGPEYSFSWSDDFSSFSGQEEEYTRNPGPHVPINANPLDIFSLIWDVTILAEIVRQTNEYAWNKIVDLTQRGKLPKYLESWVETTVDEIKKLLGILILMSLSYRARVDEYWSTGILGMPTFRLFMPRNRFQVLMRFLHFVDNRNITPALTTSEKRIAKIAPLFDYINMKFSSIYTPHRELSLDESLLLWKGQLSWAQCIRSKSARFGIKSFDLCEASSGYLLRSILYTGKDSTTDQEAIHGFNNKTAKVVLKLMDGYLDVGHLVVMDNWYNQMSLTRFLKSRCTDVLGTMNRNREFVPSDVKNADEKRVHRGEQISRHCGDISVVSWKDVRLVTLISTSHKNDQVLGRRSGQPILKPVAVEAYNKLMGGVDLKDTKLSSFIMERKRGRKWYKKVFCRLLNTSILNAYILYQKSPVHQVLTHREFRYKLAEALVAVSTPVVAPRPSVSPLVQRLDGRGHYPSMTARVSGKAHKHERPRCVRCTAAGKRSQIQTMCFKCNVALCIDKCFIEYHTLQNL